MFVRESPELCNNMKMTNHQRRHTTTTVISQSPILATSLTPTFSTINMIGSHSPHPYQGSSTDNFGPETTYSTASWASKRGGRGGGGGISSIFQPRRSATHHPSHLNVPMLSSTNTASLSFSDTWMNEGNSNAHRQYHHQAHHHHHHNFPPRPPPLPASGGAAASRSPKTIRFRDEETKDDMAAMGATKNNQVSPSPHYQSGRKQLSSSRGSSSGGGGNSTGNGPAQRSGFVSRRGRRPPMISRHATH